MAERTLGDCRILVVEDEYLQADELQRELNASGAVVLGPVGTLSDALDLVRSEQKIDGAIVDVNLHGEMAYAVADLLIERGVPLAFATGYDGSAMPNRFANVVRCEKPIDIKQVARAIGRAIPA